MLMALLRRFAGFLRVTAAAHPAAGGAGGAGARRPLLPAAPSLRLCSVCISLLAPLCAAQDTPPDGKVEAATEAATDAATEAATDAATGRLSALPPLYVKSSLLASATAQATRIDAQRIVSIDENEVVASGAARLQRGDESLEAERISFRRSDAGDDVEASGAVSLRTPDAEIHGERLFLRLDERTGAIDSPTYRLQSRPRLTPEPAQTQTGLPARTEGGRVFAASGRMLQQEPVTASGAARRIELRGEGLYRLEDASYSTCSPQQRDWEVKVDQLDLDYNKERGEASGAAVRFKDFTILALPWLSFPLGDARQSGFLTPTYGSTSKSGVDFALPWYWNIAPDMDATMTPRLMSKRGLQINSELRYLSRRSDGVIHLEYMPEDRLTQTSRHAYALTHNQRFAPDLTASFNINGVSDSAYYSDVSTRVSQVSQANYLRQAILRRDGSWYSLALNLQTYQTLESLEKPYQRLPQLTATASRSDLPLGLNFDFSGEYVSFDHPDKLLAQRLTLYPQLSLPLQAGFLSLTPKIGLHSSVYRLAAQERLSADAALAGVGARQSRDAPIFSLDASFVMERRMNWFGRDMEQTLEPRLFYLLAPARDQDDIPVFDTAAIGFSYAQMFSENRYVGGDRIGDANQFTLAVTSRLLDAASGEEQLRATVGQLYYLDDQKVTLPGETARSEREADVLAELSGRVGAKMWANLGWRYNPRDSRTEQLSYGVRHAPQDGKVLNAGYRFTRDQLDQVDFSGQWPLFGGWHGVGRYNYSLKEHRVIESIAGLEYAAGCWVARVVAQRLATVATQPTTALFFQLELNGFSSIGSNPLDLLKRNVPGYGMINQPPADPVFGAH